MYIDSLNWLMQTPLLLKIVRIVRRKEVLNQGDDLFLSKDIDWLTQFLTLSFC